jgi:hypothetical protein
MQCVGIVLGIDGYGVQTEVVCGARDANGDLAPIGDEH